MRNLRDHTANMSILLKLIDVYPESKLQRPVITRLSSKILFCTKTNSGMLPCYSFDLFRGVEWPDKECTGKCASLAEWGCAGKSHHGRIGIENRFFFVRLGTVDFAALLPPGPFTVYGSLGAWSPCSTNFHREHECQVKGAETSESVVVSTPSGI